MLESHFENIDKEISQLLLKSEKTIKIASAWLTHPGLIKIIQTKIQIDSVKVQIIISDDPINLNYLSYYNKLIDLGADIFVFKRNNQKTLMHNKFSIIDSSTVITGSFNWTKSAESNFENIIVSTNDPDLAVKYLSEFARILALSYKLHSHEIIPKTKTLYEALNDEIIWDFLSYFHEVEYNPTPQRLWRAICGTKSKSIYQKTSKMPFYNTINNYSNSRAVLNDLNKFFLKYSGQISNQFNYKEKGWNEIDFPGQTPFNLLDENTTERIKSIKLDQERHGKKWSNQELALLSDYLLKTNNVELLARLLNRIEISVVAQAKRILFNDKKLFNEWLTVKNNFTLTKI